MRFLRCKFSGIKGYHVTDEEIRQFIGDHEWVFAKTMPQIPHWYTLRSKAQRDEDFSAFVREIELRGVQRQFGQSSFTYLDFEDWTYWTMGEPVENTTLINRATLTGNTAQSAPSHRSS